MQIFSAFVSDVTKALRDNIYILLCSVGEKQKILMMNGVTAPQKVKLLLQ